MNAAGIDVSKGKSMVAVFRPFNEMVAKPFEVRHTGSELKQLADYLKSLDGETRVVMEHTGRYYEQIAQFLHDEGIYVSAVNPKIIKDYGTGNTLRHVKTDKADAKKIAKFGIDRWAELRQYAPMDTIRYQLKTLNRQCGLYTKTKTMMKNNLIALLDQTYPGVNALFDSQVREDGHQKWVDFTASFWHVDCVRSMSQTAFSERYRRTMDNASITTNDMAKASKTKKRPGPALTGRPWAAVAMALFPKCSSPLHTGGPQNGRILP